MSYRIAVLLALLLPLLAGGCAATPVTPYQPVAATGYGYSDAWLTEDLGRVKVAGNSVTGLDLLEDYALYRAAEMCRGRGAESFALVDRQSSRDTETYHEYIPSPWYGYRGYRPGYYYYRPYMGVTPATYRYTRYTTEILFRLLKPGESTDQPVYVAAQVLAELAPRVRPAAPSN